MPFAPGAGWVDPGGNDDLEEALRSLQRWSGRVMASADAWYAIDDARASWSDGKLRLSCPVDAEVIVAPWVRASTLGRSHRGGRAVVIVPALGTAAPRYRSLQRLLALGGITSVVVDLPGHGSRSTPEASGPEGLICANLGRTIHQFRKAVTGVIKARHALAGEGYDRIGVLGVSAGSCVAALASLFDPTDVWRACYTFATPDVATVVWSGEATRDLRKKLSPHLSLDRLVDVWRVLSPVAHLQQQPERANHVGPILIVSAAHDTVTRPELTDELVRHLEQANIDHRRDVLPACGHYALAGAPFSWLWAAKVLSHFSG